MMDRFRQVVIAGPGGPETLVLTDRAMLRPDAGQLLIRVTAAGVNRHDVNQRQAGHHHDGNPVPGLEVAGTVAKVGEGVTGWAKGDPVMALVQGGGYAEYALADARVSLSPPAHLALQEAAALPEALFTTAWNFFHLMRLQPGETALVHGGTSGVGHLALQLLSALGHTVYATAGTPAKCAAARDFGAARAFDYHAPNLAQLVIEATGGRGVDTLLDMSAGAHLEADLAMMAPGGRIAHLAPGKGTVLPVPLRLLMEKRIAITGSLLRPLAPALKAQVAETLRELLAKVGRTLRPHIAATYALDNAAKAHRAMERGAHVGKILLIP